MIRSSLFHYQSNLPVLLVCVMLTACATTQRGSTGSASQDAAPISEAGPQTATQPQSVPKSADKSGSSNAAAASASSMPESEKSAGANTGNAGATPISPSDSGAASSNDEAAELKRQLATQDAQISQLREEQQAEAAKVEAESAKVEAESTRMESEAAEVRAQQAAAGSNEQPAAAPVTASAGQSNSAEAAAVFPANGAKSTGAGSEKSASPKAIERSVYFGYNESTIADKYDAMILANAAYLKAHPAVKTEVQGNCDERGSREYNLALGARRAHAVKRALELGGADGGKITTLSYGAEKPVALGHDEESYSRNRRVDIVY
jgi:peptidoglycan-associated lipoprotein